MMKAFLMIAILMLVYQPCTSRSLNEEDSVVSVYTAIPSAKGSMDVYRQIAGNIADRITQPIYRFFGLDNSTKEAKTTKRPFEHIELDSTELTSPARTGKIDNKPTGPHKINPEPNAIPDRDIEELSADTLQKSDKKPEKITLFNSYLPVNGNLEKSLNDSDTDANDKSLELDEVEPEIESDATETSRDSFVYILELIASIFQLLLGGFLNLFKPSTSPSE